MTEQDGSSEPGKRCMFCGNEQPADAPAPSTRRRWLVASLALLGVAAVMLVVSLLEPETGFSHNTWINSRGRGH